MVSGALDRLHYEKDPCVKYDSSRKLWVYLHRNRTEEEFGSFVRFFFAKFFIFRNLLSCDGLSDFMNTEVYLL